MKNKPQRALKRAIKISGSQAELARRVAAHTRNDKVKQAHVWNWLHRDLEVPANMVLAVEAATLDKKGRPQVSRFELRPDIYPPEERAAA